MPSETKTPHARGAPHCHVAAKEDCWEHEPEDFPGWYFVDEAYLAHGPFSTIEQATDAKDYYFNGPPEGNGGR
jgi:hypothetical protein